MTITQTIINMVKWYETEYQIPADQINCGECVNFAEELISELGGENETTTELCSDMFYSDFMDDVVDYWEGLIQTNHEGVWSKKMLDLYGNPPVDILEFHINHHVWVFHKGKHYDSESPKGVKHWYELNFFQRAIKKHLSQ